MFLVLRLIVRKSAGGCGLCRYGGRLPGVVAVLRSGAFLVVGFGLVCGVLSNKKRRRADGVKIG